MEGEPIDELIGEHAKYDWIVASHVIEHLPDPISFFQACSKLLKPDGVLALAVPDKRYCFDYFRWPSSTGDILQAWIEKRKRHTAGAIFDANAYCCKKGEKIAWDKMHDENLNFIHEFSLIVKTFDRYQENNEYVDVHAWQFTPSSFRLILLELRQLGLINLSEIGFNGTEGCEFFIWLAHRPQHDSDIDKIRFTLCEQAIQEVAEVLAIQQNSKVPAGNPGMCSCTEHASHHKAIIQKAVGYLKAYWTRKTLSRLFLELKKLRKD